MSSIKIRYITLVALIIITAGTLVWIRSYVFERIAVDIHERLQSLTLSGFNVRYDSIRVDWQRNIIEIDRLVLEKNAPDTTCVHPESISVEKVRAEGIGLIQLVFRNTLSLESVELERPRMIVRQNSKLKFPSSAQQQNEFKLSVDRLDLRSVDVTYTDSARCDTIGSMKSHITLTSLNLDFQADIPFFYAAESLTFDNTEVTLPANFYTFRIVRAKWNAKKKAFRADSVSVIPALGKIEFGRKHGFEIDRYECFIPLFAASGISISAEDSLDVKAALAEIEFQFKVFRDRRLPFVKKKKLLPVAMLRELPFRLVIDSLKVLDSFVQYEEFNEETGEPGGIFFDNLNAVLRNINNIADSGNATIQSRARLFGAGELTLYATFPLEEGRRASLGGSIRNFSLPELNPILTPSTQMEIESGEMKELTYEFTFNEVRSDGEIGLNYEDLKLVTFKTQENGDENSPEKDNLKTFMMNTFVFKKNMTEDMPEEKRKGTVMYIRDDARSIFNFWAKSLVAGIKSAYNIDKVEAKKSDRELKKEERLSKREMRRQKRAEKKKQRG